MSCVSCVRGTTEEATEEAEEEEEEEEEEPGVSDQKQKPHTKMWGKICNNIFFGKMFFLLK